jgi:AcrR family transcriptional regulator
MEALSSSRLSTPEPGYRGGAMVLTPWGQGSELKARKLSPGRGVPAVEVERSQRERLYGAMVVAVARQGFEQTSVADLLSLSGVSRRTFYQLFDDKRDCFLATIRELVAVTMQVAGRGYSGEGRWQVEGLRMLRSVFEMCAAQPAAARLCVVEASAVGVAGVEPIMRSVDGMPALSQAIGGGGARLRASRAALLRAVTGGIHRIMYERLSAGREAELPGCAEETWTWAVSFSPLPGPLRARPRRGDPSGGAAPPFAAHIPSERILRGFAAAVAEHGYEATTIAEIAREAKISQQTFYAHFAGKEDAMMAALDTSGAQMVAATLPAVRRSEDWREGVRVAIGSMCAFLAAEPAFARLRAMEVYTAGPAAVAQRDGSIGEILEVTLALDGTAPRLEGLAGEATIGALNAVLYDAAAQGSPEALLRAAPLGTYVVLAPLLGAEAAYEICCV